MQTPTHTNPEDTAREIMNLSFLKSRGIHINIYTGEMRDTGSKFFRDNKIRSCSYVK